MTKIYTIGHSTRPINNFIKILILNKVKSFSSYAAYMRTDRLMFDHWQVYHLGMGAKPKIHQIWKIALFNIG